MDELVPIKCPKCRWRFIIRVDLKFWEKLLMRVKFRKFLQIAVCPQCLRSLGLNTRTRNIEVVKHPSLYSSVMVLAFGAVIYAVSVIVRILLPDYIMLLNSIGLLSVIVLVSGIGILMKRVFDRYRQRYIL